MKSCPTCHRTYADDSLRFCLQDGTPLTSSSSSGEPASPAFDPDATLVTPVSRNEPPPPDFSNSQPTPATPLPAPIPRISAFTPPRSSTTPPAAPVASPAYAPPRSSNKALIVGLTGLVAMLLLALSGVGFWLFMRSNDNQTSNARVADNQNRTPPANSNRVNVVNANVVSSPTPAPTLAPANVAAIKEQVTATLNGWVASTRARDLDAHMNYYADKLDTYYNAKNVDASRVEADRERAFSLYDTMDAQLSNIEITPDPLGERATATYDKTWTFEGADKYSSGSVQQRMWLAKIEGRWRIVGEKDLRVHYVNK